MPRYEFSEGNSNKFWDITLEGSSFTTRWGKIGSDGQSTTKDWPSPEVARKEYDKLIAEKTKKGYTLVAGGGDDDAGGGDGGEPTAAHNEEMERAILAAPDGNAEPYLVYADWLQHQGDPRGELIMLMHAGKDDAAHKLIAKHREHFLGDLPEDKAVAELTWRLGFIAKARLRADDGGEDLSDTYRLFMDASSARLCRELVLGAAVYGDENHYGAVTSAMAEVGVPRGLRKLYIGDFEMEESELSWSHLGEFGGVWKHLGALESFKIRMGTMDLGEIVAPALKAFTIETGGLSKATCKQVCAATWPNLETLTLYFGNDNYGGDCGVEDVQPILEGKGLPKLRSLALCNHAFADALAQAMHAAKILPQLHTLDMSKGTMADEGAQALLAHKEAFSHLEVLDVSENFVSEEVAEQLQGLCKKVYADMREDEDPDYRYTVVGE